MADDDPAGRYRREEAKGVLVLDALRRRLGDEKFLSLMSEYFAANTTRTVTAQSFLDKAGVPFEFPEPGDGAAYVASDIMRRLKSAVLVYGTVFDAGANRYSTEQIQKRFLDAYESAVPIRKDFEVRDDDLRDRDVIFVGRPESNSALAAWERRIGLDYPGSAFQIDGGLHTSEREALLFAAKNPLDASHMVVVAAGNAALATVKLALNSDWSATEYMIVDDGKTQSGFRR